LLAINITRENSIERQNNRGDKIGIVKPALKEAAVKIKMLGLILFSPTDLLRQPLTAGDQ
jgi:hypothetical protein